ncbi:hypothetical protein [Agrobacterium pusense]|uniref:hypothetical protein n=1 Tax=Agrobacterium pusense TaxID=648995 RepID=UPI000A7EE9E9|nr:hypothetical protein [Agrobacterium pusense]QWW76568.1 hypothetical protein KP800_15315 [Agrobacterium pusense]
MTRSQDDVRPEPGTDDARSTESDESRKDREKATEDAERERRSRYGRDEDKENSDDGIRNNHRS